jgi:aspartyl-tRNA(Asn)/glutamyl-tRNA(Gln) amidotransferase subunit A
VSTDELTRLSAGAQRAGILARQFAVVDLVDAYLRRIERLNPQFCAYITVTADLAREQARAADRALASGAVNAADAGALFGVPVALKDQFCTRGILTSNGSRALADHVPDADAAVVERLRAAGAILLGKLTMSELALGGTRSPPWGIPRNPWDLERTPGESSSGSGVALAAHLCSLSVGEDTGGSGRTPAAYCNLVGLRPTYGRISRRGMLTACWFLDQAAPMARTVEDCARLLGVLAGHDAADATSSTRPVPDYVAALGGSIAGRRIGVISELVDHPDVHADVARAIAAALDVLCGLGAHVVPVSIPMLRHAGAIYIAVGDTEGAGAADALLRAKAPLLDGASRTRLQAAALVPFGVYNKAMKARVLLRERVLAAMAGVDVLVSPTSPFPPPTHAALTAPFSGAGDVRQRFFFRRGYTGTYALTALPAVSVPCGFTGNNLPIGLQFGAAPFNEAALLSVAHAYEQAAPWRMRRAPHAVEL